MLRKTLALAFLVLCFALPSKVLAEENSFVTIVNPQRISNYTADYLASFQAERKEVESRNLPATWLLTYDVLEKDDFVDELKKLDPNQELGILLEVTEPFTHASGVTYNKVDENWHRATSLFLSGYSQKDRIKLIDTVFGLFKEKFGYYPKSVGSWWTDSFSQDYMQKKYGVTGNVGVSDQYDLDGYQVWGTWWSVPYYPTKINAAIPTQSSENKLDVLQFRWAARDPFLGYAKITNHEPSLYSLQDFSQVGLSQSYFEQLLKTFAGANDSNQFGHATVGLEGDLAPDIYTSLLAPRIETVKNLQDNDHIQALTMRDFAEWYKNEFQTISPTHILHGTDPLGSGTMAFWFQNPYYRAGVTFNPKTKLTGVVDLRYYFQNLEEPFYKSPNKQFNLYINLPFVIDFVISPDSSIKLDLGNFQKIEGNKLVFEKGIIEFKEKELVLPEKTFQTKSQYATPENGQTYIDFTIQVPFALKRRLPVWIASILPSVRIPTPQFYTISQTEMDALKVLENLPDGNVLTYDRDCLDCGFQTKFKPAAMAGKKGYVRDLSGKSVVEDYAFSIAKTSADARKILEDKNIKYVYLAKYEDYIETLPYLPQDLGLTRIYTNANAEIWEKK